MKTGQKCLFCIKTVGIVKYRYRLVHRWVSVMMLNVQSEFFSSIPLASALPLAFVLILKIRIRAKGRSLVFTLVFCFILKQKTKEFACATPLGKSSDY